MADITLNLERGSIVIGDSYGMDLFVFGEPADTLYLSAHISATSAVEASLATAIQMAASLSGSSSMNAQLFTGVDAIVGKPDVKYITKEAYSVQFDSTRKYTVEVDDGTVYAVKHVTTEKYRVEYV